MQENRQPESSERTPKDGEEFPLKTEMVRVHREWASDRLLRSRGSDVEGGHGGMINKPMLSAFERPGESIATF